MKYSLSPISILDNDFYKFTMQNAIMKKFPFYKVRYSFINRGNHIFPFGFNKELQKFINKMSNLKLSNKEFFFLKKNFYYFDSIYLDFLKNYRYDPSEVISSQEENNLNITIEGLWYRTVLWEVPLMAIISELYYKYNKTKKIDYKKIENITSKKIENYENINVSVAEFGTRRRHSYLTHKLVIKTLKERSKKSFVGSSNLHFSNIFNIKTVGTQAHEWFMFHGAKYGFKMANKIALNNWIDIYNGDLGIVLSDTYTTSFFLKSFNQKFSKIFDGIRHDSGDPIKFTKTIIKHYKKFNINPIYKTIIFSDQLNLKKIIKISNFCKKKIGAFFGIGTDFTNDVGYPKINIVIKMTEFLSKERRWSSVIKLSDVKEKNTGNKELIKLALSILNI